MILSTLTLILTLNLTLTLKGHFRLLLQPLPQAEAVAAQRAGAQGEAGAEYSGG